MTSSSVSNGMMDATGPKISSLPIVMSLFTSENSVGSTKQPASKPDGTPPPNFNVAPSDLAESIKPSTRFCA